MPDTMISSSPASVIPVEIAKAIVAVMAGIGKLAKVERNPHDKYDFVSIDGFLSAVNPLCAENGLVIIQDEEDVQFVERQGRNGASTWLRVTYSFTICHISGAVMPRQPRRTVMTIANGAQAFGSAQSYALKQFLRTLFQIATGDKDDSDFQQTHDMGQAPQGAPQRGEQPQRAEIAPKTAQATQESPGESEASEQIPHLHIQEGASGLLIGTWVRQARERLEGQSEEFRRTWIEDHLVELAEVRRLRPDWADKLVAEAIAPDRPTSEVAA